MQTITKYLAFVALSLFVQIINAQEENIKKDNKKKIEFLLDEKEAVQKKERDLLRAEVEAINKRLLEGEMSSEEAENLKREAAKKRALNIENRIAIIDNKIELLQRNENLDETDDQGLILKIGKGDDTGEDFILIGDKKDNNKPKKYDRRTTSDFVLALGFNNAIIEGEKLDDSPYRFGGSRFFEMGWAWKTRVFRETNFMRLKYGVSFQINGLKPMDNKYFVQQGDVTLLEPFPHNLKKSKLSISNLVFPVHFEFGPSKKTEYENYFRYSTDKRFKIGIGVYGGFNVGTRQKLKYKIDGKRKKDKEKQSFNTSNLVYGLSSYIAFDDMALYVKYDLSPIFKDQAVKQNNISIGLRFDVN